LADAEAALAALGPKPTRQLDLVDAAELARLRECIERCDRDVAEANERNAEVANDLATEKANAAHAKERMTLLSSGQCPTCEQDIPLELTNKLAGEYRDAAVAARGLVELVEGVKLETREATAELREDRAAFAAKLDELRSKRDRETASKAECERYDRVKAQHEKALADATATVGQLKRTAKKLAKACAKADVELAQQRAVEKVLGLKGPRARVLGTSLGGLEAVCNAWLERLGLRAPDELVGDSERVAGAYERLTGRAHLRVRLSPSGQTKKGEPTNAIAMEVEGAGGGHGYKAASGGERRRLDVAFILALAEVASAAQGRGVGTLWFDEVLDCLDEAGVDAVAAALGALARERCVVVITHSELLAGQLPAALRLRMEEGAVL
jgi:DNA repair exonuclease SbcCD ATPase subunit